MVSGSHVDFFLSRNHSIDITRIFSRIPLLRLAARERKNVALVTSAISNDWSIHPGEQVPIVGCNGSNSPVSEESTSSKNGLTDKHTKIIGTWTATGAGLKRLNMQNTTCSNERKAVVDQMIENGAGKPGQRMS